MNWNRESSYYNQSEACYSNIRKLSREIPAVSEYLDILNLSNLFKKYETNVLPVINLQGKIIGTVSEYNITLSLINISFKKDSYKHKITVSDIMNRDFFAETGDKSIKNIIPKIIEDFHEDIIPIVDEKKQYSGNSLVRSDLIYYLTGIIRPMLLGGLATPIGVYITDGKHQAGAGNLGLILTGIVFGFFALIIQFITFFIFSESSPNVLILLFELSLFIIFLRLTPLVRIHAAEHQTIHTIEKGLPLTLDVVKMQPRPHRRCGTNFMVLISGIFFIIILIMDIKIFQNPFFSYFFSIISLLFLFLSWKRFGMWLQKYFTTARAPDKYIKNGIKAGKEIIKKNKEDFCPGKTLFVEKLWNTGFIQILIGFIFVHSVFNFLIVM